MPLAKGIKKLFRRRSKPQSALQVYKGGAPHSNRPGASPGGKVSTSTESATEVTTAFPSESEFYFPGRDPSSNHREESIAEEDSEPKQEMTATETTPRDQPVKVAQASDGVMPSIGERHTHFSNIRSESGGTDSSLDEVSPLPSDRRHSHASHTTMGSDFNRDPPDVAASYAAIPILEQTVLPRGGISMDTKAVGRVQFGIPPETIKDSMRLGLAVPNVYIVPVERFCREMGPALGVNLAEFEFPAYFNFFVYKKQCTLVVDNDEAENNIRRVFSETLLGPSKFRRAKNPVTFDEEDFDPDFPREAIPNFTKELEYFRIMPDGKELLLETLLKFCHFESPDNAEHEDIGVPPPLDLTPAEAAEENVVTADEIADAAFEMEEDLEEEFIEQVAVPKDLKGVESREQKSWTFFQTKWIPVAVVYPQDATPEQIEARTVKRVEIFKMPGGTEYIMHDIDENNIIIGKARFSGHVKVSEGMRVDGFGGINILEDAKKESDDEDADSDEESLMEASEMPATFNPPSFGVTILGNSHGFDKSGSVSGYVLWINGRGVMIDPPPYSSATLEREGIRPRTIVAIILTHCHADHDAGAFQKVLTGSQVVVITTPTIYKSFIRKYAALSALSPALLRHSHRHKPAIIGRPLRFQGATFHFTYTLHTIPCIGFRVEWRGRSMVFTGDHFNNPVAIEKLQDQGVMSKARADDLNHLPLQETDLLLHEAGAPPIHTPLEVLLQLPQRVKRRLYVVHTSALPEDCELRVAPTGTAGTIRLDELDRGTMESSSNLAAKVTRNLSTVLGDENLYSSRWSSASNEYGAITESGAANISASPSLASSFVFHRSADKLMARGRNSMFAASAPPLVSMRPASSTDAWFILNLLSAVPFLTSLSYASTMELLETARVDAFCKGDVVVPAERRDSVLCVIWEGTCVEQKSGSPVPKSLTAPSMRAISEDNPGKHAGAVWYAGDWTGPVALQPEQALSGESELSKTHDVMAMSSQGVKVITVEFSNLHAILKSGSALYRKYLERRNYQEKVASDLPEDENSSTPPLLEKALRSLNVSELLNSNSAFRKFSAVQQRHLESLAEGPEYFSPGERLWRAGAPVDKAFMIVSGSASFVPKRRNAGSAGVPSFVRSYSAKYSDSSLGSDDTDPSHNISAIGDRMRMDALQAIKQLGDSATDVGADDSSLDSNEIEKRTKASAEQDAAHVSAKQTHSKPPTSIHGSSSHQRDDSFTQCEHALAELGMDADAKEKRPSLTKRRSSRARFANKVLGRLYSRRAYSDGLVFGSGHFLGDVSKMVAGLVSSDAESPVGREDDCSSSVPAYGFGENRSESKDITIYEQGVEEHLVHSSTLAAGKEGCVVLVFPKMSLIPFLDEYPGLLLSLLGTQVVV